ncbi:hypothetical protein MUK42_32541 [Musa troglodytarum]|uniref:Uncharacterized protein n=1 Tax=Musa troglodytarum TaxID=320322 RepID=A0A9E7FFH5_9LILI|nr:hypothetical protein MUK42_32541 [Musa troglodytarum]
MIELCGLVQNGQLSMCPADEGWFFIHCRRIPDLAFLDVDGGHGGVELARGVHKSPPSSRTRTSMKDRTSGGFLPSSTSSFSATLVLDRLSKGTEAHSSAKSRADVIYVKPWAVPAAQALNISSSRDVRQAKEFDAEGKRTIGVISKIDQASGYHKVLQQFKLFF